MKDKLKMNMLEKVQNQSWIFSTTINPIESLVKANQKLKR